MACDGSLPNSDPAMGRLRTGIGVWLNWSRNLHYPGTGSITLDPGDLPSDEWDVAQQWEPDLTAHQIRDRWHTYVARLADIGVTRLMINAKDHSGWEHFPLGLIRNGAQWGIAASRTPTADPIEYASEACQRHGLALELYFSHTDHQINPASSSGSLTSDEHLGLEMIQVTHILKSYDIATMFVDKIDFGNGQSALYSAIKSLSPTTMVLGNVGHTKVSSDGCSRGGSLPDIVDGEEDSIVLEKFAPEKTYTMPHDQTMMVREDLSFQTTIDNVDAAQASVHPVVDQDGFKPGYSGQNNEVYVGGLVGRQMLWNRVRRSLEVGGGVTLYCGPGPAGIVIEPYLEFVEWTIERAYRAGLIGSGGGGVSLG